MSTSTEIAPAAKKANDLREFINSPTAKQQFAMALPKAITGLFQGLLLFYLLTCDAFIHYRIRIRRAPKAVAGEA